MFSSDASPLDQEGLESELMACMVSHVDMFERIDSCLLTPEGAGEDVEPVEELAWGGGHTFEGGTHRVPEGEGFADGEGEPNHMVHRDGGPECGGHAGGAVGFGAFESWADAVQVGVAEEDSEVAPVWEARADGVVEVFAEFRISLSLFGQVVNAGAGTGFAAGLRGGVYFAFLVMFLADGPMFVGGEAIHVVVSASFAVAFGGYDSALFEPGKGSQGGGAMESGGAGDILEGKRSREWSVDDGEDSGGYALEPRLSGMAPCPVEASEVGFQCLAFEFCHGGTNLRSFSLSRKSLRKLLCCSKLSNP